MTVPGTAAAAIVGTKSGKNMHSDHTAFSKLGRVDCHELTFQRPPKPGTARREILEKARDDQKRTIQKVNDIMLKYDVDDNKMLDRQEFTKFLEESQRKKEIKDQVNKSLSAKSNYKDNSDNNDNEAVSKVNTNMSSTGTASASMSSYEVKIEPMEIDVIFAMADKDGSGGISANEILPALKLYTTFKGIRDQLERKFAQLDVDNSGSLDRLEVKDLLKSLNDNNEVTDQEVDWVFSQGDIDQDGKISKGELFAISTCWFQYVDEFDKDLEAAKNSKRRGLFCCNKG